jgi:hypothetical protein
LASIVSSRVISATKKLERSKGLLKRPAESFSKRNSVLKQMTNVQATYLGNKTITVMLQELVMAPSLKAPAVLASAGTVDER